METEGSNTTAVKASRAQVIEVFISYSPQDEKLLEKLEIYLSSLEKQGEIKIWHEGKIGAGKNKKVEIDKHLISARIFLLLISPNFIASPHHRNQVQQAMQRQKNGASVIPILLRQFHNWQSVLGNLAPLPRNGLAVTSWSNRDEAFAQQVAPGIQEIVEELKQYQRSLYEYKQKIYTAFQQEYPHISSQTRNNFSKIKQNLGLKDKDVELIHEEITARLEKEYNQRLQQYKNEFWQLSQSDEPLSEQDRKKLKAIQQKLTLKDEEVSRIEQEITQEIANQPIRQIKRYVNKSPQSIAIAVGGLSCCAFKLG